MGEAALTGVPVVCTDVGASFRVVTDPATGRPFSAVVTPNDAHSLAKAQINILALLGEWSEYAEDEEGVRPPTLSLHPTAEEVEATTKRIYAKTEQRRRLGMFGRTNVLNSFSSDRYLREHEQMLWIGKHQSRSYQARSLVVNPHVLALKTEEMLAAAALASAVRNQSYSLTDRSSEKPPSVFTKMIRTDSGNIRQVDELMEDYHAAEAAPQDSVDAAVDRERTQISQRVQEITAETAKENEAGGFFRFGRSLATNFHPIALWNKMWNETKEELKRKAVEEARQKQKEEAEATYRKMKQAGQLGLQPVGRLASELAAANEAATPRDSAVVLESARTSREHKRTESTGSQLLLPPKDDVSMHSGSEAPETTTKTRTLRSRIPFKRPSMTSLKDGLKRVKSDFNLAASANRESSSSLSPVKTDFENSTLKKSESRVDLKKSNKLSKRVSDLEVKLGSARRELEEALVEASPMPKLNNKYERLTPQSTLKRPKFVSGKLPSLPSERILMAEQMGFGDDEQTPENPMTEAQPRKALDLSKLNEGDETVKASRDPNYYPLRASSLFTSSNNNIQHPSTEAHGDNNTKQETSELTRFTTELADMDPNSVANFTSDGVSAPTKTGDYASLDAKLKALDKQVKAARKSSRPKKRKSGAGDDGNLTFKPGQETDDDDRDKVNQTPRKKRKSTGKDSSPVGNKRAKGSSPKQSSPSAKKDASSPGRKHKGSAPNVTEEVEENYSEDEEDDAEAEAGAEDFAETARTSIDSQGLPLEPLYEVEEETTTAPLNSEPSKPSAKATPARYGLRAARSRSSSPNKRAGFVQPGPEEQMMTRAATAAQQHPDRRGRSTSPPPANGHSKVIEVVEESLSIVPGEGGVPMLPEVSNGTNEVAKDSFPGFEVTSKSVKTRSGKQDDYQWLEDVF
ncbi:hypothetical protein LTR82_016954 [Friedmanniomyces endolithicus]|uniref:Uncharacterized protein n=1 Tax=Friedmanniomyces endolithicus TaxID=329885 RepID=A0AAN6J0Q6_9PEZI|nr:hypothetical protein LTR82_016954 [Friedmanniomyces endolithicus]